MDVQNEDGVAVVIALLALLLLTAVGASLVLISSSETIIAGNFLASIEALDAADAAAERTMAELGALADWNGVLAGSVRSAFVDGPPTGPRTMADGSTIDLAEAVNTANCGTAAPCSAAAMDAATQTRPWGANNPRWQPFAYGRLRDSASGGTIDSAYYVIVLVGDDPSENDGNPLQDGAGTGNPGAGVVMVRAEALGPRGARRVVEILIARQAGPRLLSWRELR
jgi:hypothetical protein